MNNVFDRDEEFGDGYTNEFQRAHAESRLQPCNDDRARIAELLAQGFCVLVCYAPRYCRVTDGLIGETQHIVAFNKDRAALTLPEADYDPDCNYVTLPHLPIEPTPVEFSDDGIPF